MSNLPVTVRVWASVVIVCVTVLCLTALLLAGRPEGQFLVLVGLLVTPSVTSLLALGYSASVHHELHNGLPGRIAEQTAAKLVDDGEEFPTRG